MSETGFTRANKIIGRVTTDATGAGTLELDVAGQMVKHIVYAATTGTHVTIKELITGESLTLSGGTLFTRVITGSATHRPVVNQTNVTGSNLTSTEHPTVDKVIITVASGGNTKPVNAHIYVR